MCFLQLLKELLEAEHCYFDWQTSGHQGTQANDGNSKLPWECLNRLNTLGSQNKIRILWISGHVGLQDNETANLEFGSWLPRRKMKRNTWGNWTGWTYQEWSSPGHSWGDMKDWQNFSKKRIRIIVWILPGHCRHLCKVGWATWKNILYEMPSRNTWTIGYRLVWHTIANRYTITCLKIRFTTIMTLAMFLCGLVLDNHWQNNHLSSKPHEDQWLWIGVMFFVNFDRNNQYPSLANESNICEYFRIEEFYPDSYTV